MADSKTTITATGSEITYEFVVPNYEIQKQQGISFHIDWGADTAITGSGNMALKEGNFSSKAKAVASTDDADAAITVAVTAGTGQEKVNILIGDTSRYYYWVVPIGITAGTIDIYTNIKMEGRSV